MGWKRTWDSSCPRVYDTWEADGKKWVIQDLPPEQDEEALAILVENLVKDEVLCQHSDVINDPESVEGIKIFWRVYLAKRTTLACYAEENGERKIAALNVCVVVCQDDEHNDVIIGKSWKNVYDVLEYVESRKDVYEYMSLDKVLYALGLVVVREFRGARLGVRMLLAREPLCKHLGVGGTSTVFTGPASQKSAERSGFESVAVVSMRELADIGLQYPRDENKVIKLMVKKFK